MPDAERVELRAEIAALIRTADAQARAWQALADRARALPELWKRLTAGVTADPDQVASDAPSVAPLRGSATDRPEHDALRSASTRSDHLGASTYVAKGWSAFAAADFSAAESAFERALALAPDETETLALLAWARAAGGRDDEALLAAQGVLTCAANGPAASLARVAIGRVCIAKGIAGEAIEHLARVARDDDDRRATLYATMYLGVAYARRGMYGDAVAMLRRALVLGPNLVEARYELGCTHWRAGAREAARAEWRAGAAGTVGPW
ncbi:MAG: tetratricopeptide repeat protein, partial [Candidatus Eremiobacteraeota bacterium]|nr:tetratricopeptide repeat protein [Candidatus Eremiobacteraeota bacterium]